MLAAGEVEFLTELDAASQWQAHCALLRVAGSGTAARLGSDGDALTQPSRPAH